MMILHSLWSGEFALGDAFWTWAVTVGLVANLATSVLFLVLTLQDLPLVALIAGYGVSVPYNIVATVGVWRSAEHYAGPAHHAQLARVATLAPMAALTLT